MSGAGIPAEAVEAIHSVICEESLEDHMDPDWPGRCVKAAAAAAPHLMAAAWAEGHEDGFWNGRLSHGDPEALTGIQHAEAMNPYRKPANE
jgi:hypothetical protein